MAGAGRRALRGTESTGLAFWSSTRSNRWRSSSASRWRSSSCGRKRRLLVTMSHVAFTRLVALRSTRTSRRMRSSSCRRLSTSSWRASSSSWAFVSFFFFGILTLAPAQAAVALSSCVGNASHTWKPNVVNREARARAGNSPHSPSQARGTGPRAGSSSAPARDRSALCYRWNAYKWRSTGLLRTHGSRGGTRVWHVHPCYSAGRPKSRSTAQERCHCRMHAVKDTAEPRTRQAGRAKGACVRRATIAALEHHRFDLPCAHLLCRTKVSSWRPARDPVGDAAARCRCGPCPCEAAEILAPPAEPSHKLEDPQDMPRGVFLAAGTFLPHLRVAASARATRRRNASPSLRPPINVLLAIATTQRSKRPLASSCTLPTLFWVSLTT